MKKETTHKRTIDDLLTSLDQVEQVETSDFFYAKIKAKLESDQSTYLISNILQPAWVMLSLCVLLLLNWATISQTVEQRFNHPTNDNVESIHPGAWELKDELVGNQNFSYE